MQLRRSYVFSAVVLCVALCGNLLVSTMSGQTARANKLPAGLHPDERLDSLLSTAGILRRPVVTRQSESSGSGVNALQMNFPWVDLVFTSYQDNSYEIYRAQSSGYGRTRLTWNDAVDIQPDFRPGNTQIAFVSYRDGNPEIYLMNADGAAPNRLTAHSANDLRPQWSPQGTDLAFYSDRDGNREIYLMNASGGNLRRLTNHPASDITPAWSPDGAKIVFASDRSGTWALWTMNADGTSPQQLSPNMPYAAFPDWSTDGTQIAYSVDANNDGWLELAIVNTNGTGHTLPLGMAPAFHDHLAPTWAPVASGLGTHIAFSDIGYVLYQGQLYWESAQMTCWCNGMVSQLQDTNLDWWPAWRSPDVTPPTATFVLPRRWSGYDIDLEEFNYPAGAFKVEGGASDQGGWGVYGVEVDIRSQQGAWQRFLPSYSSSSGGWGMVYIGQHGHTYYLRARAVDLAGNAGPFTSNPNGDWVTTVDIEPPHSLVVTSSLYSTRTDFIVSWSAVDALSGIAGYGAAYSTVGPYPGWERWIWLTPDNSATFYGQHGVTYWIIVNAGDRAGNYTPGRVVSTTVDAVAPSAMITAPAIVNQSSFTVTWSGSDSGTGIVSYDIQTRSSPTMAWTNWLSAVPSSITTAVYTGTDGRMHSFRIRARDRAGNLSSFTTGDASTLVDLTPPVTIITAPQHSPTPNILVSWSGADLASGVLSYDVEVRDAPAAAWVPWLTYTQRTRSVFQGQLGRTYEFRARARDRAGNTEAMPVTGVTVKTPLAALTGWVRGNRGQPVVAANAQLAPLSLESALSNWKGEFTTFISATGSATLVVSHPAFGALPARALEVADAMTPSLNVVLPPLDNAVCNGDFESDNLACWSAGGDVPPVITTTAHTGHAAVSLSGLLTHTQPVQRNAPFALVNSSQSWVEQRVTPTASLNGVFQQGEAPVLSILYLAKTDHPITDTLQVVIAASDNVVTFTAPLTGTGWQHAWWLLPEWSLGGATLRLQWIQSDAESESYVLLDDVSIGRPVFAPAPLFFPLIYSSD